MRFIPAGSPVYNKLKPGWWLFFRKDELLIKTADGRSEIPFMDDAGIKGMELFRVHYLGTLNGCPCYTADLSVDARAPEGMVFEGVRLTFGLLGEIGRAHV